VKQNPDVNALASRGERSIAVMVWNYHDDDLPAPAAQIELLISGAGGSRALLHHYRVDGEHSNSYEVWKQMGEPQSPSERQYEQLEAAGQLALAGAPEWRDVIDGEVRIPFALPRQGVSLLTLRW
jgi:xylan 1,4-beta-xylosidase